MPDFVLSSAGCASQNRICTLDASTAREGFERRGHSFSVGILDRPQYEQSGATEALGRCDVIQGRSTLRRQTSCVVVS